MFVLKKVVSRFIFPVSLILELLIIGLVWPKKRKKFLIAGIVFLFLFSSNPFAAVLLWPLESRYPPLADSSIRPDIQWVVVLGGGITGNKSLTPEDRLNEASVKRLLEGIRLCRYLPKARLILSGGDYQGTTSVARVMKEVALNLGIPPSRLILEESSWDTQDEARMLKKQLGQTPFYLVTSAGHMPRSMALFKKAGTRPIASPTDFHAVWGEGLSIISLFPQARALLNTELAFYEYFGLLWGWVNGYF
ncbi:MAG: hypothetical protein C0407_03650 [Desulfobacca sp.]|nr:hypothetical protein [Desulfobacca sp.]